MENNMYMVIMFPDSSAETVRKTQAIMQFIDGLGGFIFDHDEDTDDGFLDDSDLPF